MPSAVAILDAVDWLMKSPSHAEFVHRSVTLASVCCPSAVVTYHHVSRHRSTRHYCQDARADSEIHDAWRRHAMNSPVVQYYLRGGTDPLVATQDLVSDRILRSTALYSECWKPFGVTHQVGLRLWNASSVSGLSIKRDGGFRDQERKLLQAVFPHFLRAFRATQESTGGEIRGGCESTSNDGSGKDSATRTIGRGIEARSPQLTRFGLTPRECEVVAWITKGKRDSEIAIILGCAPRTVSKHVENILVKFSAETRTAVAAMALADMQG